MSDIDFNNDFNYIVDLISTAKQKAYQSVNKQLIELYWQIGKYLYLRVENEEWGKSVIKELSKFITSMHPNIKGYSSQNLWRMKQLYESYKDCPKLSTLLREISWSHNLRILSSVKSKEEKEFYIRLVMKEKLTFKELGRQIDSSYYERVMIGNEKLSTPLRVLSKKVDNVFKDSYVFEMFHLLSNHSENELKIKITQNITDFLLEFGRDFAFMGKEYPIQVGSQDFSIDLLFYHRILRCLVAIELKIERFKPQHLGQLNFYLEALDRNVKIEDENPSIGILLCKGKDDAVVEYALSRNLSPAIIADYKTQLPNKKNITK
ncbi:MAG: PDDEXK nuclease domain-containing protein [Bacteroidota bacterium]|nr:PDDEXK nuclease domain-containing protein [Bacteroidota bacterium]